MENRNQFEELNVNTITNILNSTIKNDDFNKTVTLLSMLLAYTEDSQFNICFNGPSSAGKSYIPKEISELFPKEDVITISNASPTAFFHGKGQETEDGKIIDLSRKIIIFLDQAQTQLLERLRPLLSHDEKYLEHRIADKNKSGLRTKKIILVGFPVVVFCTATNNFDEQEITRMLFLSPEMSKNKINNAIDFKIEKESDRNFYSRELENNLERTLLQERINLIKNRKIKYINIKNKELVKELFKSLIILKHNDLVIEDNISLRHNRDITRFMGLIKSLALINMWNREIHNDVLIAEDVDIYEAFKIWKQIYKYAEHNLPEYLYIFYEKVVFRGFVEKNNITDLDRRKFHFAYKNPDWKGLTRQELRERYKKIFGQFMPDWKLRQELLPILETSLLIIQKPDPLDQRRTLVYPIKWIQGEI